VKRGTGFIYYVSREGVTGMQSALAKNIGDMTAKIRTHTPLPIAVGFGISNPKQAGDVAQHAEAIVVGSAVVNQIAKNGKSPELVVKVTDFTAQMVQAVKAL
jgi:tryptophan synthase alpha chain